MKSHTFKFAFSGLILAFSVIVAGKASAQSLASSSFGGCGTASAQGYVSTGGFQPTAERPSTTGAADSYAINLYPGLFAAVCVASLPTTPVVELVTTAPGEFTLVAAPDLPGWVWMSCGDLQEWSVIPDSEANPVLLESLSPRQFFRYVKP